MSTVCPARRRIFSCRLRPAPLPKAAIPASYKSMPLTHDILQGPPPPVDPGWGGGDGDGSDGRGANRRAAFTGLIVGLITCVMLFAALTSAFVVRRGMSDSHD